MLVRIYEIQLLAQGRQRRFLEADDVPEYPRQVADVFEAFLFLVAAYERREVAQCIEKEMGAYLVRNSVVLAAEILDPEHLDFLFMPVLLVDHQHDAADQQTYRIRDDQIPDFVVAQREPRFFGLQRDDQHGREDDSRDDECAHQAPYQEGEPPAQEYFQQQDGRQPQDAEPDDRYGRPFRPPGDCYQRIPVLAQLDQESRHRDGPP